MALKGKDMTFKVGDEAHVIVGGEYEAWRYGVRVLELVHNGKEIRAISLGDEVTIGLFFPRELQKIEVNSAIPHSSVFPEKAEDRKKIPVASGVIDYFPAALAEVAKISYAGNEQHNPGESLHWARNKSTDQADTIMRHFIDRGKLDSDGLRHSAKLAWRALALLQLELEAEGAPIARGAK